MSKLFLAESRHSFPEAAVVHVLETFVLHVDMSQLVGVVNTAHVGINCALSCKPR